MKRKTKRLLSLVIALCITVACIGAYSVSADVYDETLPYSKDLLYGRNALGMMENGETLVEVYDLLYTMVEEGTESLTINTKQSVDDIVITVEELQMIWAAHRFDNPQQFWVDQYGGKGYSDGTVAVLEVNYIAELITPEKREEFKNKALQFIADAGVTSETDEYDKALLLHDAVVEHIEYVLEAGNAHNAYGALIEGQAVCEGYAELYQYLLYLCGMQSHIVTGNAGEAHAWNLVRIDNEYYMCDPTWSDQEPESYGFYNVTTEVLISSGRTFNDYGYSLPLCIATRASYFNNSYYGGRYFKDQPSVQNAITQIKYYGVARFAYNGEGTYTYAQFREWCSQNVNTIYAAVGGEGLSTYSFGNEFGLICEGNTLLPLPEVELAPRLTAIAIDTAISVIATQNSGALALCPMPECGKQLAASVVYDILNNERIEFVSKKDGYLETGSKIKFGDEEATVVVSGDVDGDGLVTVFDALFVKKASESTDAADRFTSDMEKEKIAADINRDGNADGNDSKKILKNVVGNG